MPHAGGKLDQDNGFRSIKFGSILTDRDPDPASNCFQIMYGDIRWECETSIGNIAVKTYYYHDAGSFYRVVMEPVARQDCVELGKALFHVWGEPVKIDVGTYAWMGSVTTASFVFPLSGNCSASLSNQEMTRRVSDERNAREEAYKKALELDL